MLKIEEYFLPTMTLRVTNPVSLTSWHSFGDPSGVASAHHSLLEALHREGRPALRTLGVYELPTAATAGYYVGAVEVRDDELDTRSSMEVPGGYFLCVEHVGPLATLGASMEWFYDEYVPTSPYAPRSGVHLALFDPRFEPHGSDSVMTFGLPVNRRGAEH